MSLRQKVFEIEKLNRMRFTSHVFMREIYAVTTAAFLSSTIVQVYPETNWICEETAHHVLRQDSKYLFQVLLYDSHCLIMQLFSHAVINIYRETKDVLFLVAQFEAMLLPLHLMLQ